MSVCFESFEIKLDTYNWDNLYMHNKILIIYLIKNIELLIIIVEGWKFENLVIKIKYNMRVFSDFLLCCRKWTDNLHATVLDLLYVKLGNNHMKCCGHWQNN